MIECGTKDAEGIPGIPNVFSTAGKLYSRCESLFMHPGRSVLCSDTEIPVFSDHCAHCVALRGYPEFPIRNSDIPRLELLPASQVAGATWTLFLKGISPRGSRSRLLRYIPSIETADLPTFDLLGIPGAPKSAINVRPQLFSKHTSADDCFEQIQNWLRTCTHEHKLCNQSNTTETALQVPTRLIDVTEQPRLVEHSDGLKADTRYVTVSHRWTRSSAGKLFRSTRSQFKREIRSDLLAPVFRDAIAVTKRLGINYVWIDALCILQDDPEDWANEASLMGLVYRNAYCNLGASGAADRVLALSDSVFDSPRRRALSEGLFQSRSIVKSDFPIINLPISQAGQTRHYFGFTPYQLPTGDAMCGLNSRGWIFQERLLSPRSIYFDEKLTWECSELLANENFPEGAPTIPGMLNLRDKPFRITTLLKGMVHKATEMDHKETYKTWRFLTGSYAACDFTYRGDLFTALSGLTKHFQSVLHDEYVAGLWKGDMINGLLWYSCTAHGWLPEQQEAPSWSWAAARTWVTHYPDSRWADPSGLQIAPPSISRLELAAVQDFSVTLATTNPLGPVRDCYLCISGTLIRNQTSQACAYDDRHDVGIYDQGYVSGTRESSDDYFLPLIYVDPPRKIGLSKVQGLILEATGRASHEYRRVGAFGFMCKNRIEFKDLDFVNAPKTTIVLV